MRIDYLIPDQADVDSIESYLREQLGFSVEAARQEQRIYFDSFDWRLYNNNTVLEEIIDGRQRSLELRQLNSGNPLARARLARKAVFARDLPAGLLQESIAPVLEMRELLPLARTRTRVHCLRLLNKDEKTIARIQIEESSLQQRKGARTQKLADRLVLLPVRGYRKPVAKIKKSLEENLQLAPDTQEPLLGILSVAGIMPGSYSSKLDIPLEPDMRADQAIRVILRHLFDTMLANEAGTRKGTDSEFLHDFRVAVRRTRSVLGQIKGVLPRQTLNRYKREFAWLGQSTGNTRDLDVYLLNFAGYKSSLPDSAQADIEPLHEFLHRHWQVEHKALVKALDSARYRRLVSSWQDFLEKPVNVRSTLPNARRPVYDVACNRIWRVYRRILKEGKAIEADTPAEALHDLRKNAKKLRYLMEFFQRLYAADGIRQLIGILKGLQNNLGDFQDYEVQVETLKRFGEQMVEEGLVTAGTLLAMGMLIEGLEQRQRQARDDFARQFTTFSLPENQQLFHDMFASAARTGTT